MLPQVWKGILFVVVGATMIIFDLAVEPVFSLPITSSIKFPIGLLAILVGGLYIVSHRIATDHAELTQTEVATWGQKLELATPKIIAMSEKQLSTEYIAEKLEKELKIPEEILLKYMYAMRNYLQKSADVKKQDETRS